MNWFWEDGTMKIRVTQEAAVFFEPGARFEVKVVEYDTGMLELEWIVPAETDLDEYGRRLAEAAAARRASLKPPAPEE